MNGRRLPLSCVLVALILGSPVLAGAQQPSHPVLDAPGIRQDRVYSSEMPFEHIDAFTGSLVLTFTDLVKISADGRRVYRITSLGKSDPYINLVTRANGANLHIRW